MLVASHLSGHLPPVDLEKVAQEVVHHCDILGNVQFLGNVLDFVHHVPNHVLDDVELIFNDMVLMLPERFVGVGVGVRAAAVERGV